MSNGSFTNPISINAAGLRLTPKRLQKYIKYEYLVRTSYARESPHTGLPRRFACAASPVTVKNIRF